MAEKSQISNENGVKITKEILKLIGWNSTSFSIDIDCCFPTKHKPHIKNDNSHHGIDFIYSYDNPLYHENRDIIIGSIKHSQDGYHTGLQSELKKEILAHSVKIECAKQSDEILQKIGTSKLNNRFIGFFLCLSSSMDEANRDILSETTKEIDFGTTVLDEMYILDNKRATFLVSCIKTAQTYMKSAPVKFLYQNTGKNMEKEQLLLADYKLPVQLINSEIIPILKEENNKISCLIFCANNYSKESLSRLIWFSHKLCGYTNEIRIYFPDYDNKNENEVNFVKQTFKDESFTSKISIHRFSKFDFVTLKENQESDTLFSNIADTKPVEVSHSAKIEDDIDKILPYADILLPKLRTSLISEPNLLNFLFKKGIVTTKKTKEELLKIFTCLILSPNEFSDLKKVYVDKENAVKDLEWTIDVDLGNRTLWEVFSTELSSFKNLNNTKLPKNTTLFAEPFLERIDNDNNKLFLKYKLEKENTNKDFLTGKTYPEASFEIHYANGKITFFDHHTSSDTYKVNKDFHNNLGKALKKNNLSSTTFKSISFLDFNNNSRVQFLLSFMAIKKSDAIKVKKITPDSVKLRVDSDIENIPKDLESLKGRVSTLSLHGKDLENTIYFAEEAYRKSILCEKINLNMIYEYLNRKGICNLEFSFHGALGVNNFKDAEFQISISPIASTFDTNFQDTKSKIMNEITLLKTVNFDKYKQQ